MFGIGMPELLLVLAVALIVIGPKKLPDLARSLGRALGETKKATEDLKGSLGVDEEMGDVKKAFDDMNREVRSAVDVNPLKSSPKKGKSGAEESAHTSSETQKSRSEAEPPADGASDAPQPGGDNGSETQMSDLKNAFDGLNEGSATAADGPANGETDLKP